MSSALLLPAGYGYVILTGSPYRFIAIPGFLKNLLIVGL
jgi:hypothetical protein